MLSMLTNVTKPFGIASVLILATTASLPLDPSVAEGSVPSASAMSSGSSQSDEYLKAFLDTSPDRSIMTVGHRTAWREAPENSLEGLDLAISLDVEVAEIDIRQTQDGHLVLMHDTSVDRTTNGSGKVSDLTLAEIEELRLKELMGGEGAQLTDSTVPTLREIFERGKGKILFNLDKAWNIREEVYQLGAELDMTEQLIFKGSAEEPEVSSFLESHEDALYCHIVRDSNYDVAHTFIREPNCYEVVWKDEDEPQIQDEYMSGLRSNSRIFVNTMWEDLAGNYTDEASLLDPDNGWAGAVSAGADMIQTDNPAALNYWLDGNDPVNFDKPTGSVRVLAENYNESYDPNNKLKVCDAGGNIHVCWIRADTWLRYAVDFPEAGYYDIRGRVASKYEEPAGLFKIEFDDWISDPIPVRTTTGNQYFLNQDFVDSQHFDAGTQDFYVRMSSLSEAERQNFNFDWFQFDLLTPTVTPEAPTFTDEAGSENDTYTIPTIEGVDYLVDGKLVDAGVYPGGKMVTVNAQAKEGFEFPEGVIVEWSHTFENDGGEASLEPVRPANVNFSDEGMTFTIPSTEGVEYRRGKEVVAPGVYEGAGSVTITAHPASGFRLIEGAVAEWTHIFTPVPEPSDSATEPSDSATEPSDSATDQVSDTADGELAETGSDAVRLGVAGLALLLGGIATVLVTRKRQLQK